METYLKNIRFLSANIALAMLVAGFVLHYLKGPNQAFYIAGPYLALTLAVWSLGRFGRFATANDARDRVLGGEDFGRQFLVGQIHSAHTVLVAGCSFATAVALMSAYRWVPALFVVLTVACVELALLGRRRRVLVC